MRWGAFIGLLLGLGSVASADAPPGYWDVEAGLKGKPLKAALHAIIDDHEARSYSALRDELSVLDAPPEGRSGVLLIYRRATVPADTWPNYNREHLWPQSKGAQRVPAKSDAHHIFASDTDVNQRRGNLEFGECEADCSIDPEAPLAESNRAVWEPPQAIKGDIARALFYMAVRYEGVDPGDTHGEPDLELVESGSTIGCRCMGQLADLRRWHLEDDVSADEKRRHEAAFAFQGNRNPFVDHPEWVAESDSTAACAQGGSTRITYPQGPDACLAGTQATWVRGQGRHVSCHGGRGPLSTWPSHRRRRSHTAGCGAFPDRCRLQRTA